MLEDDKLNPDDENKRNPGAPRGVKRVGRNLNLDPQDKEWWANKIKEGKPMDRREANTALALITGGVIVGAMVIASVVDSDDEDSPADDETEVKKDALAIQEEQGWNVGAANAFLAYPVNYIVGTDCEQTENWRSFLDVKKAVATYIPKNPALEPYFVPTLLQSLKQTKMLESIKLFFSPEMAASYSRGLGFKDLLKKNKNNEQLAIIVDMPGEQSVAFAAAMSDFADPVLSFDNWPHPMAVVPAHHTLSALLYYAPEFEKNKEKRKDKTIPLFVLDRKRFAPQVNEETQFDNRYIAKLPTIKDFNAWGIKNVMYCVFNEKEELDDINDDFVSYQEAGVSINMINLADFKENPEANALGNTMNIQNKDSLERLRTQYRESAPVYHYGGGPMFYPVFYGYHPYMSYGRTVTVVRNVPSGLSAPTYKPISRPTIFSSRSTGGVGGVGKVRPSGFGRISTRVSNSTGRITGVRTGRMGSFGRVGGRGG